MAGELTYGDYINVPGVRALLRMPDRPPGVPAERWPVPPASWQPGDPWPRGGNWAHDEALFITTHQAFEVWFRQLLIELDDVLATADERARAHGAAIPRTALLRRMPERAPILALRLKHYPQLAATVAALPRVWQDAIQDTPAPATFAEVAGEGGGAPSTRPSLGWFEGDWSSWSDRLLRATRILEVTLPFYSVLATMTPASFLTFRDRLAPASGFGSGQFREVELVLGQRERHLRRLHWMGDPDLEHAYTQIVPAEALPALRQDTTAALPAVAFRRHSPDDTQRIRARFLATNLRDLVYWLLGASELCGAEGERVRALADQLTARAYRELPVHSERPDDLLLEELSRALGHPETVIATEVLRNQTGTSFARFLEACLSLDEALVAWRDQHIRFVERMIGSKPGTGGGGVIYLRGTVQRGAESEHKLRAFPALWAARSFL